MSTKISDQDQKWLDEINKLSEEGVSIAKRLQLEKYVWRTYSKSQYQELCNTRKVIAIDDIHKTRLGNVANLIVKMK